MKSEISVVNKLAKKEYIEKFIISIILRGTYLIIPFFYSYAVEYITNGNLKRPFSGLNRR